MRGWVFYDAECPLCVRGVARWGGKFLRRGFAWTPLQTPGTAAQLGLTEEELRAEMRLLLPDGRVLGGVRAWCALFRSVWWLWPLGVLLELPGLRAVGVAAYRWIARRRHCLTEPCPIHGSPRTHRRHRAFFELP